MTYETAHKILSAHQAWRRGLVDVMEYTPAEVSEALELAITALQSDPDAPDWSKAPKWARWYAIDLIDLKGYWYENEPIDDGQRYLLQSGKYKRDINANFPTLFKRPDQ